MMNYLKVLNLLPIILGGLFCVCVLQLPPSSFFLLRIDLDAR